MADPAFQALGGDLPAVNRFLFTLDSVQIGVFSEVRGLELSVAVEEFGEGGQNGYTHRVPGRMSWPNITFKRGVTQGNALFEWLEKSSGEGFAANSNKLTRATGAIQAIDWTGKPLRSWNLIDVFPIRWKGPEFSVGSNDPLQEELEIAHHGFTAKTH
jgi:phage tail-like protein